MAWWRMGVPTGRRGGHCDDPAGVVAPTMIVVGEWDRDTPPALGLTLFSLLRNAQEKRFVLLGEGTHTVLMERNRMALFQEVQGFLGVASERGMLGNVTGTGIMLKHGKAGVTAVGCGFVRRWIWSCCRSAVARCARRRGLCIYRCFPRSLSCCAGSMR